jgi:hypothetical protein
MDAVWLIMDSVSFESTSFFDEGPETTPRLSKLADQSGTVFTQAYAPGPSSPSSHSAFFTGELPSITGMHEAHPYFHGNVPTIADTLDASHETRLITSNMYLVNGLNESFDSTVNLLKNRYLLFEDGPEPRQFAIDNEYDSSWKTYLNFITKTGAPLKAFLNGINYKIWDRLRDSSILRSAPEDDINYQYANTINKNIRSFLTDGTDQFVVANYMDAHPPLDASDEALSAVTDYHRNELPMGVRGQDVHEEFTEGNESLAERMQELYYAALWDIDRKLAPLIENLISEGKFVILTADHGQWFRRESELEEARIHVPLVVFSPDSQSDRVEHTVNLLSLPKTTVNAVGNSEQDLPGTSLLEQSESQQSITEFIHPREEDGKPISPHGGLSAEDLQYDATIIKDIARVNWIGDQLERVRGTDSACDELVQTLEELRTREINYGGDESIEYSQQTEKRLEDLGYL